MSVIYISSGLFKSDGVWQHPKRIIDSYEIIFMHEGTAFICEEESEYILKKNDILVLEPGKLHYGFKESVEFVSFSWLHFKALKEKVQKPPQTYRNHGALHTKKPAFPMSAYSKHTIIQFCLQ